MELMYRRKSESAARLLVFHERSTVGWVLGDEPVARTARRLQTSVCRQLS